MSNEMAGVVGQLMQVLEPLQSLERKRAVGAALMLLGDAEVPEVRREEVPQDGDEGRFGERLGTKARAWMRQNGVSRAQLEPFFDLESDAAAVLGVPSMLPKKDQVIAAYLFMGIAALLSKGEPSFSDKDARELCASLGCYDVTNHSKSLHALGSRVIRKNGDCRLTTPGLRDAAELLKRAAGA